MKPLDVIKELNEDKVRELTRYRNMTLAEFVTELEARAMTALEINCLEILKGIDYANN